jgi:hypothetical protein
MSFLLLLLLLAGGASRQTWIELCQKARLDPHDLVSRNLDKLFRIILVASAAEVSMSVVCLRGFFCDILY